MQGNLILSLKGISKTFDVGSNKQTVLNAVSLDVREHEFLAVMGPSGAGKTTLLNIMGGLEIPDEGEIFFQNKKIDTSDFKQASRFRAEHIGFIFQNYNLVDELSVRENIELASTIKGNYKEVREKIPAICKKLQIEQFLDHYPIKLSGGERQRCACARALCKQADFILADEPTGALDRRTTTNLVQLFQQMIQEEGISVVLVTHDPFVASFSNRVIFIQDGIITDELTSNTGRESFYQQIIMKL